MRNDQIRKRRNENLKRKLSKYSPILNKLKLLIIPLTVILMVFAGFSMLSKSDIFKVTDYTIITDKPEDKEKIISYAQSFFEENNFFVSESTLKEYLSENIGNVRDVYIRKSINSGFKIEVIFRVPEFYLVNFSGTYILSPQGQVVDIFSEGSEIAFTDLEKKYIENELTPDSEEIRSIYLAKIEDAEERAKVVWKEVPAEDKNKILQEIKDSAKVKQEQYIQGQFAAVKNSEYSYLTGFTDYKEEEYELNEYFDQSRLLFMQNITKEFQKRSLQITGLRWISEFSLGLFTDSFNGGSKEVIFSAKRDLLDQFKDIDTLIFYNTAETYRVIDLRSENYVLIK